MDFLVRVVENAALLRQSVFDAMASGEDLIKRSADFAERCDSRAPAGVRDIYKEGHQGDDGQASKQEDRAFGHTMCSVELEGDGCAWTTR